MDVLLAELISPAWWLSVVLVSIVINITSAYLKGWLDNLRSRVSATRRKIAEQRRQHQLAQLERLRNSPVEQILAGREELAHYLWAITLLLIAAITIGTGITLTPILRNWTPPGFPPFAVHFPGWISELFTAIYMFFVVVLFNFALREIRSAVHTTQLINEARNTSDPPK